MGCTFSFVLLHDQHSIWKIETASKPKRKNRPLQHTQENGLLLFCRSGELRILLFDGFRVSLFLVRFGFFFRVEGAVNCFLFWRVSDTHEATIESGANELEWLRSSFELFAVIDLFFELFAAIDLSRFSLRWIGFCSGNNKKVGKNSTSEAKFFSTESCDWWISFVVIWETEDLEIDANLKP